MSMLPGALRAKFAQPREDDDWYTEPHWAVAKLFDTVPFEGSIHDPCCGGGTIPLVAKGFGYTVTGSDLIDRGFGQVGVDFFADLRPRQNIVSNPPYKLGAEFVLHALDVTERKVAVIMRLSFLAGQGRLQELYHPMPPAEVIILSRRPSMPPGRPPGAPQLKAKNGTADYCWIVYDRHVRNGQTILKWA